MCESPSMVVGEAAWNRAPTTCSGRIRVRGKAAQARSCASDGSGTAALSTWNASVAAMARIRRRRSKPCAAKSSASSASAAGGSPAVGRSSTGSTRGRPSISAQTRLAVARARLGFLGSVTHRASRDRRLPSPGSSSGANGTRGSIALAWPILRSVVRNSPSPSRVPWKLVWTWPKKAAIPWKSRRVQGWNGWSWHWAQSIRTPRNARATRPASRPGSNVLVFGS